MNAVPLTVRETAVLRAIAQGLLSREIAAQLNISKKTVDRHRERISRKLGVHGTARIVMYAFSTGLVEFSSAKAAVGRLFVE